MSDAAHSRYVRRYAELAPGRDDPAWLRALRDDAIARFDELGFPTHRLEEWKYTRTRAISQTDFTPHPESPEAAASRNAVEELAFPLFACSLFVFVNGRFSEELSTPRGLSGDLHVRSIARLRSESPSELEGRLGSLTDLKKDAFAALNTAFFDDGAHIHLPPGTNTEQPIHLVFVNAAADAPRVTHPRVLITAEQGSCATAIVDHVSLTGGGIPRFTNVLIETKLGANAQFDLVQLQRECDDTLHVSRSYVEQERDSRFASHTITLGGALVRNDLELRLADEGAECRLNGLFLGLGTRHIDNHTLVDHAVPHGTSHELYKGILGDHSRGVFRGRVIVRPNAQKTSAEQSNPNLLMSDDAEIDTKPQLEIRADDVRCSHGSTIGQLDPAALFYLRSRGIGEVAAKDMLTQAFGIEVTDALPVQALGEAVREMIVEQLGSGDRSKTVSLGIYDVERVRRDFPILEREIHGKPLVFLDSAASAQKPRQVMEAMTRFNETSYANIHRGVYTLSQEATAAFEGVRARVARFIGASDPREVVFTRNATEGINLVAQSWGAANLREGDEVLISAMEHHANIVPWQMICQRTGAVLRVAPIDDRGALMLDELEKQIGEHTRIVALAHVSNALGTINPVKQVVDLAHEHGALVLVDGAQAAPHLGVDVAQLESDFYVFTAHKLFGPTGVGILHARLDLLESMPPYQGGGDMIETVTFEKSTFAPVPYKFEAGTPDITGVVGLGAAIDYVELLGLDAIAAWEHDLLGYATQQLEAIPGLRLVGTAPEKAAVVSFILDCAHPHDIGTILDQEGIAVRTGHHCAQPVMERFGVPATARASFSIYNTRSEVDVLVAAVHKVRELFA